MEISSVLDQIKENLKALENEMWDEIFDAGRHVQGFTEHIHTSLSEPLKTNTDSLQHLLEEQDFLRIQMQENHREFLQQIEQVKTDLQHLIHEINEMEDVKLVRDSHASSFIVLHGMCQL